MSRAGALYLEVDVTDIDTLRGRLMAVCWAFDGRLECWQDGDAHPVRLRSDLECAALVIGHDLHRVVAPHVAFRFGYQIRWPRLDLRSTTAADSLLELERRYGPPSGVPLPGIARRIGIVRLAWLALARHR
jgi:hypothetical protein